MLGLGGLVHRDHVGMLERSLQPALASETLDELGILTQLTGEHLERDPAAMLDVARTVDGRHPTAAEHTVDAVVPDHCSWIECHEPAASRARDAETPQPGLPAAPHGLAKSIPLAQ